MAAPRICGVDEAGRGPLAGAVYAAAVILDPALPIAGLRDSKKLSESRRAELAELIKERALCWSIASASVEEIDRINILQATMLAMTRAVAGLNISPDEVLVDGNRCPPWQWKSRAIVGGDDLEPAISAASILAKTARDGEMMEMHLVYPCYGFDRHKGYPTVDHLNALRDHGISGIHRRSFGPVRRIIEAGDSP